MANQGLAIGWRENYIAGIATLSASPGTDGDYPLTNLTGDDGSRNWIPWRSSAAAADVYLQADLGSAKTCNFCAFSGHNLVGTTPSSITIRGSSSAASGYTTYGTFTVSGSRMSWMTLGVHLDQDRSFRYWRLYISGVSPKVPMIGTWWLGDAEEFATDWSSGQLYGYTVDWNAPKVMTVTPIGGVNITPSASGLGGALVRKSLNMKFNTTSNTALESIAEKINEIPRWGELSGLISPDSVTDELFVCGRVEATWGYSLHPGGLNRFSLSLVDDVGFIEGN